MKRVGNIFNKIVDFDNLVLADKKARRNKKKRYGIKRFDKNYYNNLLTLQKTLIEGKYKTSKYDIFTIIADRGKKEREIYRLPYYPDRITHHAIMNVLEPIWEKLFIHNTYSCRKGKGIHAAVRDIKKVLKKDREGTKYCLKLDIRKFYPSIDHSILKQIIRKKIKDKELLYTLDEIINSAPGVPIGNYLSQYFANLYLTYFDHWLKETLKVKYYFRYADDIVILHDDKNYLHQLRKEIELYLNNNLKLQIKNNYQVFNIDVRGLDFVGFVFYHDRVLLRKSTKVKLLKTIHKLSRNKRRRNYVRRKISSYCGWLKFCNSINLYNKRCKCLFDNYNITSPEVILSTPTIISNIIDKVVKIISCKIYDKYFKLYVVLGKMFSINSHSISLYNCLCRCKARHKYRLKLIKNKYEAYEITV